ncbi:MAG TPA: hypothetical protein VFC75_02485, partial [Erysipelothrix sp.]|nr:hypothetical protein [Erysipelothrix sp.]
MNKRKDIYWGLILILVGTTMVLNLLGIFGGFNVFSLAWSIIFLALFANALYKFSFVKASLFAAILAHINIDRIGLGGKVFPIYAASLLIGIGLNSIFKSHKRSSFIKYNMNFNDNNMQFDSLKDVKEEYQRRSGAEDLKGERVYFENNMGSNIRYIKSTNLKSARIENNLGTSNVYFTDATFSDEGCIIDVECNLGKINIYLPQHINFQNNITTALGSVRSVPSFYTDASYPTVILEGEVNLGDV